MNNVNVKEIERSVAAIKEDAAEAKKTKSVSGSWVFEEGRELDGSEETNGADRGQNNREGEVYCPCSRSLRGGIGKNTETCRRKVSRGRVSHREDTPGSSAENLIHRQERCNEKGT